MLYAFGSNGAGQLGIRNEEDVSSPQACSFNGENSALGEIRQIVAGGNHTLVLFESGDLYFAGSNVDGRAGRAHLGRKVDRFHRADLGSSRVKMCSAVWEASVIVTTEEKVYTCGTGFKGELGTGQMAASEPHSLPGFPPAGESIIDVASGVSHTVVVLANGDVWGWGNGRKGQLGEPAAIVHIPRKIQGLNFSVVRAVCGSEFTYLVGDPQKGHHAVFGHNKWNLKSGAPPDVLHWNSIGASWGSIFVLKVSGKLESWGRNDHGQLAPPELPRIVKVAVGSEHVLALTVDMKVVCWGWGEHGNCGPDTNESHDVDGQWNEIATPPGNMSISRGLAAGCATSFAWT